VKTSVSKLCLAILISALFSIYVSCRPLSQYCAKLEISTDLHLTPSHPLSEEPSIGSFYVFDHTGTGLTLVHHFQKTPDRESPVRVLYLETDRNQVLDRTVKSFQILKGRFGTVYAEKTCFYTRPIESSYSFISVHSYFNSPIIEVPSELSRPPNRLPPLTSLSLVRVFRTFPEYLIVAANYEATGELGSLHIDGAKDGDWIHSNFVPAAQDGFVQRTTKDSGSEALKKYGIPAHIDVQEYLRSHRIPIWTVSLPRELSVLNLHYGYNRLIRQDVLNDSSVISTRFLQPSVTEEENTLNSQCESRFRQQQTLGLATVE
jgi:hypothetical protein